MKILTLIATKPKSAKQLSKESGIPITTVHRKLKVLENRDLLLKSGKIEDGIKERMFQKKDTISSSIYQN